MKEEKESKKGESMCVSVSVLVCTHIHVEIDGGDVMSGIDPLNMAPSQRNGDVIHRERQKRKAVAV